MPVFEEDNLEVEINYDQPLGVTIATVSASDSDSQAPFNTVRYHLVQNDVARRYFAVDIETGDVSVRRDLAQDSSDQYEVSATSGSGLALRFYTRIYILYENIFYSRLQLSIQARDLGQPQRNSESNARVQVRVARNKHSPRFTPDNFAVALLRDTPEGSLVADVNATDDDQKV